MKLTAEERTWLAAVADALMGFRLAIAAGNLAGLAGLGWWLWRARTREGTSPSPAGGTDGTQQSEGRRLIR